MFWSFGVKTAKTQKHVQAMPTTHKQKVSAKGFKRHTLMIKPEHLAELQEIARLAKADMQDVLAAALEKYFSSTWPDDKREKVRAIREKEAQEKKESLL